MANYDLNNSSGRGNNSWDSQNGIGKGSLTEPQIRQIIRDELMQNAKSGTPIIPVHRHDGNDVIRVSQKDIITKPVFNGSIVMKQTAVYTIPVTTNPSTVTFYGAITNPTTAGSVGFHSIVIGQANFGNNYQFQPGTGTSVTLNNIQENIIQGCSSLNYQIYNPINTNNSVSQGHIVYASFNDAGGAELVYATVTGFNNSAIQISVVIPAGSGYQITGLWIVT